MINIIITPNMQRAELWARENRKNIRDFHVVTTQAISRATHMRRLDQEGDTVVWIDGWQEGMYADQVAHAIIPCITESTTVIEPEYEETDEA